MTAALVGLICVATSGVILIALHFLPTGLNPIRYAVSDYGWTSYHLGYRAMVVLQGVGAILIALGLAQQTDAKSLGWLYVYGVVRVLISRFMTDREPESVVRSRVPVASTCFSPVRPSLRSPSRRHTSTGRARPPFSALSDGSSRQQRSRPEPRSSPADSTRRVRTDRAHALCRCHRVADRSVGFGPLVATTLGNRLRV